MLKHNSKCVSVALAMEKEPGIGISLHVLVWHFVFLGKAMRQWNLCRELDGGGRWRMLCPW